MVEVMRVRLLVDSKLIFLKIIPTMKVKYKQDENQKTIKGN